MWVGWTDLMVVLSVFKLVEELGTADVEKKIVACLVDAFNVPRRLDVCELLAVLEVIRVVTVEWMLDVKILDVFVVALRIITVLTSDTEACNRELLDE